MLPVIRGRVPRCVPATGCVSADASRRAIEPRMDRTGSAASKVRLDVAGHPRPRAEMRPSHRLRQRGRIAPRQQAADGPDRNYRTQGLACCCRSSAAGYRDASQPQAASARTHRAAATSRGWTGQELSHARSRLLLPVIRGREGLGAGEWALGAEAADNAAAASQSTGDSLQSTGKASSDCQLPTGELSTVNCRLRTADTPAV